MYPPDPILDAPEIERWAALPAAEQKRILSEKWTPDCTEWSEAFIEFKKKEHDNGKRHA
jgi:hypothetical protein